jgi:hypothetical protein
MHFRWPEAGSWGEPGVRYQNNSRSVLVPLIVAAWVTVGCTSAGTTAPGSETAAVSTVRAVPSVSGKLVGPAEPVFDTLNACEQIDIPDAFPRAYRDYTNRVHLIATHYVARAMVGADLDHLKRDCRIIYRSPHDPDPAHFLDTNWLTSLYTEDGQRIAALAHTEFHGDAHPGMCGDLKNPNHPQDCAWTTITFAESRDGGYRFEEARPPANLVASLPYPYDKYNKAGAQGYDSPTNILKVGPYYYSMINVWREYKAQRYGPCLIRTASLFDASSWRGWDGKEFSIRFIDPYLERSANPAQHVCLPVVEGTIDSFAIDRETGIIIGDVYVEDNRYGQGPGFYLLASHDLIRWSKPSLVVSTLELLRSDHRGNYSYLYFALLDPKSTDRNFTTVSSMPYVYFVRLDDDHPPYTRVLFRRRISITVTE